MSVLQDTELIKEMWRDITRRPIDNEPALLHACRMDIEPFVYDSLNRRYGEELQKWWDSKDCRIPLGGDSTVVIVERRIHVNLRFILQNAAYYARGWSIAVICSDDNRKFVEACCGSQVKNITIIPHFKGFGTPEQGKTEYNTLLQTAEFWNMFTGTEVLMMETDTYLTKKIPIFIRNYDYVASKWPWAPNAPGGGGLSYRKLAMMKHVCSQNLTIQKAQDCFISDAVIRYNYKTPTYEESYKYFGEFDFAPTMCGTHQWWTGIRSLTPEKIIQWLTCEYVIPNSLFLANSDSEDEGKPMTPGSPTKKPRLDHIDVGRGY